MSRISCLEEIQIHIQDGHFKFLRTKEVESFNVHWMNIFVEKATWEAYEDLKKRYPHVFE